MPPRPRHPAAPRVRRGFTLIELMMAVAIVGILVAVAYPSYRDYIIRGQLVDATNALATMRANMERYYLDNRTYQAVGAFTPPCSAADASTRTFGDFVVSCPALAANSYTLAATGSGALAAFTFTVTEQDARATTAAPAGWGTCATKWILKKGQAC